MITVDFKFLWHILAQGSVAVASHCFRFLGCFKGQSEKWLRGKQFYGDHLEPVALARRPVSAMDPLGALSVDLWKRRAG